MKIIEYNDFYKTQWDEFIEESKNGTFLLKRDYMEYHRYRFEDCSYIIMDNKNKIKAVIPGTIEDKIFYSHKGLTYGGFIINRNSKMEDVLEYFNLLNQKLKQECIESVVYKSIPSIYHNYPSQEEEYALFLLNAKLIFVGISSTIDLTKKLVFNKSRKSCISKSKRFGLEINEDKYYEEFWEILKENLMENHKASPVHSLIEIKYLKKLFPNNIKLYTASLEKKVLAGVVVYEEKEMVHIQYISASDEGKNKSALDFIFNVLLKEIYNNKKYFDFGTSVEDNGKYLNKSLIFQKEGFGARGVVYKHYKYFI